VSPIPARLCAVAVILFAFVGSLGAGERTGRKTLVDDWEDGRVIVRRTLYSLVFDERARFMPFFKRHDRVAGLTVATPTAAYYQFDARREYEDPIVSRDPDGVLVALRDRYRRSAHLEMASVQEVEGVMLVRYEPGAELVVSNLHVDRDRVRVDLRRPDERGTATTLTVQWPAPFSGELLELPLVEQVLERYIQRR
jgi:hypothetical protein